MDIYKKIQKIIEKEVDSQVNSIKLNNEYLVNGNERLNEKIISLENTINNLKKGDLFAKYAKNINERNLTTFLTFVFEKVDNEVDNDQVTKAPSWFYNIVRYWNKKRLLLEIYDLAGIKYDKWILTFKMPYEWGQEQCDLFIKNINRHYVSNGAIYNNNLGFWLQRCKNKSIEESIQTSYPDIPWQSSYSNIPWQLVLKNPLWLKKENFDKILNIINDNNHGRYFTRIYKYQELSQAQIRSMILKMLSNPKIKDSSYTEYSSLRELVRKLDFSDIEIWNKLKENNLLPDRVPDFIRKQTILEMDDSLEKLIKIYKNSSIFNKKELKEMITKLITKVTK